MAAADVMGMQVYQSNPAYRRKRETPVRLTYGCNISGVAPVTVSFIYTTRDARTQRALGGGRAVCLSTRVHCRCTNNASDQRLSTSISGPISSSALLNS